MPQGPPLSANNRPRFGTTGDYVKCLRADDYGTSGVLFFRGTAFELRALEKCTIGDGKPVGLRAVKQTNHRAMYTITIIDGYAARGKPRLHSLVGATGGCDDDDDDDDGTVSGKTVQPRVESRSIFLTTLQFVFHLQRQQQRPAPLCCHIARGRVICECNASCLYHHNAVAVKGRLLLF